MTILTSPTDKMPIGKHKGKSIQTIIENHTSYATWMINSMKSIGFSQLIKNNLKTWKFLSQ